LPVKANIPDIEFCVRQVGNEMFLLACKRNSGTANVTFSGLPSNTTRGAVLYEPGRTVSLKNGTLTDRFTQFDVHVYRLQ
jgi:hypothetical protein